MQSELWAMCQVIFIDLVLAGDNAIVVGMVAAGVAPELRRKVIIGGIAMAVILRICFAGVTMQLLSIVGLTLAGGLLLLWVCWKLYRELQQLAAEKAGVDALGDGADHNSMPRKTIGSAIWQVAVADVSMSLDNVLAVAGAADDHPRAMVFGLLLSVVLMGIGAAFIAGLLQRHAWIAYLGLAVIGYVSVSMIWRGSLEVAQVAGL
ncbi:MAG: YjbE family putative metal transport protein [Rhodospirillaceae bacterium]|nr:YjbE family putative metal transport protein [Rhodospirillaceae bacterium]MBT5459878.1 YjbE family putative metal transport protein [Rhodospirillaceae bacterium]